MLAGVLHLDFHLAGCASLKEKRRRLSRLRDKFGRVPNLAICETGHQDSHQRATWSVVAVASEAVVVEQSLTNVERWVAESVDAIIVGVDRAMLPDARPHESRQGQSATWPDHLGVKLNRNAAGTFA